MGQILLDAKIISATQLKEAQALSDELGIDLRQALVQKQIVNWEQATRALAQQHNLPYLDVSQQHVVPDLIRKVPPDLALRENLFPLLIDDQDLLVAVTHALNLETLDVLRFRVGMPVRAVLGTPPAIRALVQKHYGEAAKSAPGSAETQETEDEEATQPGDTFAGWLWRNAKWVGILLALLGGTGGYFAFQLVGAVIGAAVAVLVLVILLFTLK
jgi:hypothetical protein